MLRDAIKSATRRGYTEGQAEAVTEAVWRGVVSTGGADLIGVAVADTTPTEYAALLATDDIAAAFATAAVVEAFTQTDAHGSPDLPTTPHQSRQLAYEGWASFRELADQAGHLEHGTGADMSAAWPVFKEFTKKDIDQDKIRRIAELAGRMFALLKGQKAKRAPRVPEEVTGVELGGEFGSLLPHEYARLGHEATKRELMARVARRQAQQLRREGKEKKGRGPLVLALDESGSMEGGDREIWAKAVATALTRIAWEDKRPVRIVHFSTATKVHKLDPGDHAGLLKAQNLFLDGGTDIGVALDVAADEVDDMAKAGVPGADVVLISDGGDAGARVNWALDKLDRHQTRLWSIAIQVPMHGALKERAAEYIYLLEGKAEDVDKVAGAVLK
jgi:uncharacterized protein with von Willebrand factor type A (vWA) domain